MNYSFSPCYADHGGRLIPAIRQHHAHISHHHTAGNPGRCTMGAGQEINYPAVAATGYRSFMA